MASDNQNAGLAGSLAHISLDPGVPVSVEIRDADGLSELVSLAKFGVLLFFSDLKISRGSRVALQGDSSNGTKWTEENHISMQTFAALWDAKTDSVVWQGSLRWSASGSHGMPSPQTAAYLTDWLSHEGRRPSIRPCSLTVVIDLTGAMMCPVKPSRRKRGVGTDTRRGYARVAESGSDTWRSRADDRPLAAAVRP